MSNPERCKCGGLLHPNADDEEMLYCEKCGAPKNSAPPAIGEKPAENYEAKWIAQGIAVLECTICGAWVEPMKSDKHDAFHVSMRLSPCLTDWLNLFRSMGGW